jgi:hypothetical protein
VCFTFGVTEYFIHQVSEADWLARTRDNRCAEALQTLAAILHVGHFSIKLFVFKLFDLRRFRRVDVDYWMVTPVDLYVDTKVSDTCALSFYRGRQCVTFVTVFCVCLTFDGFFWQDLNRKTE